MPTSDELRVVVIGATGNVGTALMKKLAAEPRVSSVVGVARRLPSADLLHIDPKVSWDVADISLDRLDVVQGADVVVHLAWMIQPSREESVMLKTNVTGTGRLLDAIAAFRVAGVVYASSVGTYVEGPKDRRTDESWSPGRRPSNACCW